MEITLESFGKERRFWSDEGETWWLDPSNMDEIGIYCGLTLDEFQDKGYLEKNRAKPYPWGAGNGQSD